MYEITVPISNRLFARNIEKYLRIFKNAGAKRVLLAITAYLTDPDEHREMLKDLTENAAVLHENGFECSSWASVFSLPEKRGYTLITSTEGEESEGEVCPSDPDFVSYVQGCMKELASTGVDMILFDDDYRYGYLRCGLGCTCKNHRAYMSSLLGEDVSETDLRPYLFRGGKNRYRSAFIKANGYYLEAFAEKMREAVDEVNPDVRVGICACMDVWDFDGTTAYTLSKKLAGNTRPFLRLIGAPYWAAHKSWGNRIQDVIELEKMEYGWCGKDVEVISEGDTFTRTRYNVPSSMLELFDLNLRVYGKNDGIQKYFFDYTNGSGYDMGYYNGHIRNRALHGEVSSVFEDKEEGGIYVLETMNKFENAVIPKRIEGTKEVQHYFYPAAARALSCNGIPFRYGQGETTFVFGENAWGADMDVIRNAVIDLRAAEILTERGIDVGLIKSGEDDLKASTEYYLKKPGIDNCDDFVLCSDVLYAETELKDGAEVLSVFCGGNNTEIADGKVGNDTASYIYENGNGQKFLVFCFNTYFNNEICYRNYYRQEQIVKTLTERFGASVPAFSLGNPDLYMQFKTGSGSDAVAVSNCSMDRIYDLKIDLDREYSSVRFLNCTGRLEGKTVIVDDLPAFTFCAFELAR